MRCNSFSYLSTWSAITSGSLKLTARGAEPRSQDRIHHPSLSPRTSNRASCATSSSLVGVSSSSFTPLTARGAEPRSQDRIHHPSPGVRIGYFILALPVHVQPCQLRYQLKSRCRVSSLAQVGRPAALSDGRSKVLVKASKPARSMRASASRTLPVLGVVHPEPIFSWFGFS